MTPNSVRRNDPPPRIAAPSSNAPLRRDNKLRRPSNPSARNKRLRMMIFRSSGFAILDLRFAI